MENCLGFSNLLIFLSTGHFEGFIRLEVKSRYMCLQLCTALCGKLSLFNFPNPSHLTRVIGNQIFLCLFSHTSCKQKQVKEVVVELKNIFLYQCARKTFTFFILPVKLIYWQCINVGLRCKIYINFDKKMKIYCSKDGPNSHLLTFGKLLTRHPKMLSVQTDLLAGPINQENIFHLR